jgi:alpha-1,6-mannosyltransferase
MKNQIRLSREPMQRTTLPSENHANVWLRISLYVLFAFWIGFSLTFIPRAQFYWLLMAILGAFFLFGLLVWKCRGISWKEILITTIVFRLVLLFTPVQWSDDIYRFFWDGMKVNYAESPYHLAPKNDDRKHDWPELYNRMNSINFYSPYPPLLQYIWGMTANATGDPTLLRSFWICIDVLSVWLLYQLLQIFAKPKWTVLLYAWNPLILFEGIGQLHPELLLVTTILLFFYSVQKQWMYAAGFSLGMAICTKLWPLFIIPLLFHRLEKVQWLRIVYCAIGLVILCYAPLLRPEDFLSMSSSFMLYFQSFEFNASVYYVLKWLLEWLSSNTGGAIVSKALGSCWLLYVLYQSFCSKTSLQKSIYLIFLVLSVVSAVVHPWYLIPLLVYGLINGEYFVLIWSPLIFLSYSHYSDGLFVENPFLIAVEYILLFIGFWIERKIKLVEVYQDL